VTEDFALQFRLNGEQHAIRTPVDIRLVDLLRENFALTAAKTACRIGRCGSCLVLVNGHAVNSCLLMAWQIEGADIVSAEGLATLPEGRIVREALVTEVAFQCGYCAPGFTVALTALFRRKPDADESDVRAALGGNLCRCTGYASILRGAALAQQRLCGAARNETDHPAHAGTSGDADAARFSE
jgi:aerobic-type carbon monoxide dehydrogenase small subunit (CoxS/CutS family)